MNKEVKRLITFFTKAIIIVLTLDFAIGKGVELLYNQMTVGEKGRANYLINRDTSEVIIFGSSRAMYHYHSGIIADSLELTVYNAGRANQTILYHLAVLKSILKRHTPKAVILDIQEDEFVMSQKKYEFLSALLPYCHNDKDIAALYSRTNSMYKFWSWSRILPYNSSLFAVLYRGLLKGKDQDIRGYLVKNGATNGSPQLVNDCNKDLPLDPLLENSFLEFISLCKTNRINIYVVVSPRYTRYTCSRPEFKAIEESANSLGLQVLNFADSDPNGSHFADPAHLNSTGSIEFSKKIASTIKRVRDF